AFGLNENWSLESGWTKESAAGIGKLNALDVICGKDHMTVRAEFNGPFNGIVFSKGTYGQENCVYIKPYSGTTHATFKVKYDECGTKPDLQGKYYENTIVIQYGTDIIEAWDEAKRLRCEWFEAYEKPATFRPAIPVADLDVVEMNFQGDDIDCWMEIQEGKGPWGREVSRIVPVGQPMTIVIAINDYYGQFDMRVKSCFAHDGVKPPIHLTDEYGCVLRPKMLTPFNKVRDSNGRATIISYSHFYAFKFPDSMNVQIQCTVEVCRHGCPDACQKGGYPPPHREIQSKVNFGMQTKPKHSAHRQDDETSINQNLDQVDSNPFPASHSQEESSPKHPSNSHHEFDIKRMPVAPSNISESQTMDIKNKANAGQKEMNNEPIREDNGEESNPVVKVLEIDLSQDHKKPTISEQTSGLSPEDIKQASKFLADMGLNMNLNNLATNLMEKMPPKELSQLLRNEKMKELIKATDLKLNKGESIPEPQPLVGSQSDGKVESQSLGAGDAYNDKEFNEAQPLIHLPSSDLMRVHSSSNQTKIEFQKPVSYTYNKHTQSNNDHDPNIQPIRAPVVRPNEVNSNPMVQVMNIPLQLGLPPIQMQPPANNFINQHPQQKPQRPSFFSNFQLPKLNIPFIKNEILMRQPNILDQRNTLNLAHRIPENHRPVVPFPHGPRSLRLKRSETGPEINVRKQFQVVTSIDLSFSPNVTTDIPPLFEGRREEIVNGVCMPVTGLMIGLSAIFSVILCALSFSVCAMLRINKLRKRNASVYN
ncbi:Zona pellucida-like domain containing protein 7, partial [Dinothrombium tinctorium]